MKKAFFGLALSWFLTSFAYGVLLAPDAQTRLKPYETNVVSPTQFLDCENCQKPFFDGPTVEDRKLIRYHTAEIFTEGGRSGKAKSVDGNK